MYRFTAICLFLHVLCSYGLITTCAQELRGAKAVIEEIQAKADELAKEERQSEWEFDLQALSEKLKQLPPTEAASAWLKIVERWSSEGEPNGFSAVIGAVPAPEAWAEIKKQMGDGNEEDRFDGQELARRLCLRALVERLAGDLESVHKTLLEADGIAREHLKRAEEDNPDGADEDDLRWAKETREKVRELENAISPQWNVERFKKEIAQSPEKDRVEVKVPDLTAIVGPEETATILEQAFSKEGIALQFDASMFLNPPGKTLAVAMRVAKAKPEQFSRPIWALCHSIDSTELYERFLTLPPTEVASQEREDADTWYVLGLLKQRRVDDAIQFISENGPGKSRRNLNFYAYDLMRKGKPICRICKIPSNPSRKTPQSGSG